MVSCNYFPSKVILREKDLKEMITMKIMMMMMMRKNLSSLHSLIAIINLNFNLHMSMFCSLHTLYGLHARITYECY